MGRLQALPPKRSDPPYLLLLLCPAEPANEAAELEVAHAIRLYREFAELEGKFR